MGRARPTAREHARTPVLSPISLDGGDVMDLPWPPLSSRAQCIRTIRHSRPDNMPARCQHLPLKHWWDDGTHAGGERGWRWGWTAAEKRENSGLWEHWSQGKLKRWTEQLTRTGNRTNLENHLISYRINYIPATAY